MTREQALATAERWFDQHGLPYFVDAERASVRRGLRPARLLSVVAAALLVGAAVGVPVGLLAGRVGGTNGVATGMAAGLWSAGLVAAVYAATTLRLLGIARWAGGRTLRSVGMMFPLVTRALPMLLLFITFLFINTEVWMVADSMDAGVLALSVMLFAGIAVGFLLVRLPEEMDRVDDDLDRGRMMARLAGSPLSENAREMLDEVDEPELARTVEVAGLQKWNLVLVLLVAQALQVLLLSAAVWLFFLAFGTVVMDPDVVRAWLGDGWGGNVAKPLFNVSVFLAGFSGLYFTVYAITDEAYRSQFFASVVRELERAVAIRAVYRLLQRSA